MARLRPSKCFAHHTTLGKTIRKTDFEKIATRHITVNMIFKFRLIDCLLVCYLNYSLL